MFMIFNFLFLFLGFCGVGVVALGIYFQPRLAKSTRSIKAN